MDQDIVVAAHQVVDGARSRGLTLRLLGGMAIKRRCPSTSLPGLARNVPDIDLITVKRDARKLGELFAILGLEPVKMFNALHGDRRMLFMEPSGRQIDVFIDVFEMCHTFDFRKRMALDDVTLSLADLLVTKLQIIEINEKDYKDITAVFLDHDLSEEEEKERVNAAYIARLCASDWGVWRTLTRNLDWTRGHLEKLALEPEKKDLARARITALLERIEREPKSVTWKLRSAVGERMLWYDLPDRLGKISTDG